MHYILGSAVATLLSVTAGPFQTEPVEGPLVASSERSKTAHLNQAGQLRQDLRARGLNFGAPIFIQIFKDSRELDLHVLGPHGFERFRTYWICQMSGDLGPKLHNGDHQAPEGFYQVTPEWMNPNSSFHLSFNLGYPNRLDRQLARTGNNIMIHGDCVSEGCFAMTDEYMEEIYTLAEAALLSGQPAFEVHVFPFRMTEETLQRHQDSPWISFWENLRSGYDYFEQFRFPPVISTDRDRYLILPHDRWPTMPEAPARSSAP